MRTFLKILGILVLLLSAYVLIGGLLLPKSFHLEKSVSIKASKDVIWQNVSMFSNFRKWSPWNEYDPDMKVTITGTDGTPGAVYAWEGNKDVGSGTMTYTAVNPQNNVKIDLNFLKPFKSRAKVVLKLDDEPSSTKVTWAFDTEFAYPFNALVPFMGMEKNLGNDFLKGMNNLKRLSESGTAAAGRP